MILEDFSEINFKILSSFYLSDNITKYLLDDFLCNLEYNISKVKNREYVDILLYKLQIKKIKLFQF
jgi:hypothetical protein